MTQTARRALLAVLVLACLAAGPPAATSTPDEEPSARSIMMVGMTVSDLERSIEFFTTVLDFEQVGAVEVHGPAYEALQGVFGLRMRVCTLRLGDELIELTEYLAPEGRPIPADSRSHDRWFQHIAIITRDMDEAYARLRAHDVRHASTGPQRLPDWNPNAGGIEAFYFKDPDGHILEVLAFPPGKGHPRWHPVATGGPLFLGIDHTAIVVEDTADSLRFYRDHLGLEVVGRSENHGTEQEHLNNVFGARLRITTLRFPAPHWNGPALELLEYVAPADGRPYPPDSRANDLWHWQTTVRIGDLRDLASSLPRSSATWVSPGPTDLPADDLGFTRGLMVRDPDGHAVRLVER